MNPDGITTKKVYVKERLLLGTVWSDKRITQDADWKDCDERDKGIQKEKDVVSNSLMLSELASK